MNKHYFKLLIIIGLIVSASGGYFIGKNSNVVDLQVLSGENEAEQIFATFKGGQILGKEVLEILHKEVSDLKIALTEGKRRVTLERARQHLLEIESKNRKMTADQLLAEFRLKHQEDPVSQEEWHKFVMDHGLNEKKMSKIERENVVKVIRSTKVLAIQNDFTESLFKAGNVKLSIPGPAASEQN